MGSSDVRSDFLAGNNGAVVLSSDKLDQLDSVYKLVTPSLDDVPENQTFEVRYFINVKYVNFNEVLNRI